MSPNKSSLLAVITAFRTTALKAGYHRPQHRHYPDTPAGFTYLPNFLTKQEQHCLTTAALTHLDNAGPAVARRKLKRLLASGTVSPDKHGFLPEDSCYQFEPGHFDGVIRHYREARITDDQWRGLDNDHGELSAILQKLRSLLPTVVVQSHILHLSSNGEILPHVDNVHASGSIILGVSLGSPRTLRLEPADTNATVPSNPQSYECILEAGSCYIQKEPVRYTHKHSVLIADNTTQRGQRLSIMMRDLSNANRQSVLS